MLLSYIDSTYMIRNKSGKNEGRHRATERVENIVCVCVCVNYTSILSRAISINFLLSKFNAIQMLIDEYCMHSYINLHRYTSICAVIKSEKISDAYVIKYTSCVNICAGIS